MNMYEQEYVSLVASSYTGTSCLNKDAAAIVVVQTREANEKCNALLSDTNMATMTLFF